MSAARLLLGVWLASAIGGAGMATAQAADGMRCLGPEQRRATIATHRAIPLSRALRAARGRHGHGRGHGPEVVRARLCESGSGLVYVLTLLAHDGKVTRVTIDAGNGRLIGRH
jgi:uncharacterized membrane protein YkoI